MVRLREIQRTAAFAWSPGASKPLIVTGTRAGAVDADFSDETKLELWDLSLDEAEQGAELQPVASIASDARFYDLAWGQPDDKYAKGIIAGALESGSLDLYDAAKLLAGASAEEALISRSTKHSGPIKSVQFNPIKSHYLATAGAKGELFVYDVNDMSSPFRLGTATARPDDLECVAWNRKVAHILASGSAGGLVTVWDLKTKKTSVTLNNNRKPVSAIEWDPNYSTKLLTASYDDATPVIYLWDLRNSNAPERTMQGHVQGVLSLSWCPQDPDLLLSCGKDSRTLVWNPQTGELYGEFQEGTNWNFSTRFNPHNPSILATAGFDGKLVIQTLQNTNQPAPEATVQSGLDGEDFFASAQTQPKESSFTLAKAPKWMERPAGASFGFGGKLVVFKPVPAAASSSSPSSSKVMITQFSADTEIAAATDKFEESLATGDLEALCAAKEDAAKSDEEKADWTVIKTLSGGEVRDSIVKFLGFSKEEKEKEEEQELEKKEEKKDDDTKNDDDDFFGGDDGEVDEDDFLADLAATKAATTATIAPNNTPFSLFNEDETHAEQDVTAALVLGNFEKAVDLCIGEKRWADAFLIANCGGATLVNKVQTGYLAQQEGKPSYIRLLSSVISKDLWDVVNNANLDDWRQTMAMLCTFAADADFADLCEALGDRILAAESGDRKDASFCYVVGSKLDKVVNIWIKEMEETREAELATAGGDSSFSIHARSLQSLIEKVTIFRAVTKFEDKDVVASASTTTTQHWKLSALYDKYTEYADLVAEQGKLAVAQKYLDLLPTSYSAADIARERVKLATGSSKKTAAAATANAAAAKRALPGRQPAVPVAHQPAVQPRAPSVSHAANSYAPPAPAVASANPYAPPAAAAAAANPYAPAAAAANPYAPAASYGAPVSTPGSQAANPYAPAAANPYAPAVAPAAAAPAAAAPQYGGYAPPVPAYGAPQQNFSAPPRNTPPAAGIAPPSKAKNMTVWNDVPMVTKPAARKAAPPVIKASPISSPFAPGANLTGPPPANPYGAPPSSTSTPPPPKGPAPNRVTSPLAAPPRPSSTAASAYAPAAPAAAAPNAYAPAAPPPAAATNAYAPPPVSAMVAPRVNSPYNTPPPAAAPPSNRYAPAPATMQTTQPPLPGMVAAPPTASNPYGPPPTAAAPPAAANPYAPAGYQAGPPMGGPPMGGPPMSGPPMAARGPVAPPPRAGPPPMAAPPMATPPPPTAAPAGSPAPVTTPTQYSAGVERRNIPANAQRMVEIFTRDMKRVAASAPATYSAQVKDTQKRINILFDCLNKGELVKPDTIEQLATLAEALDGRDYAAAQKIQADIQTNKPDECGKWIVGVKRLLSMSKATP